MEAAALMQYWDGSSMAAAPGAVCSPGDLADLARSYKHPDDMMALGDSLYNGVSSLRLNWWLAEWSAPTQVAIPLGLIRQTGMRRQAADRRFWNAQYPASSGEIVSPAEKTIFDPGYPVASDKEQRSIYSGQTTQLGFDLEQESLLHVVGGRLANSVKDLLGLLDWRPPNGRLFNDNIAFQGADSTDLLTSTPNNLLHQLAVKPRDSKDRRLPSTTRQYLDNLRNLNQPEANTMSAFGMGFFAINGAYVLNPMRDPCLDGLSPIEQVELRRPKRVLINIGSNNGIWKVAFGFTTNLDETYRRRPDDPDALKRSVRTDIRDYYVTDMAAMIDRLDQVPGLRYVYINGLMPPSRAANLMPSDGNGKLLQNPSPVGADKYYDFYRPVFSLSSVQVVSGSKLKDADDLVRDANAKVRRKIAETNAKPGRTYGDGGVKFVFVDMDELTGRYDYKHRGAAARRIVIQPSAELPLDGPIYLDNRATAFGETVELKNGLGPFTHLSAGGIFSLDNMHLTPPGYGLLASTVFGEIMRNEHLEPDQMAWDLIAPANLMTLRALRQNNLLRVGTAHEVKERDLFFRLLFKVQPADTSAPSP